MSLALFISKTLNFPFFFQLSPTVVPQLVPQAGLHLWLCLRLEHAEIWRHKAGCCQWQRSPGRKGRPEAAPAPASSCFRRRPAGRQWCLGCGCCRGIGLNSDGFAANGSPGCALRWSATCSILRHRLFGSWLFITIFGTNSKLVVDSRSP